MRAPARTLALLVAAAALLLTGCTAAPEPDAGPSTRDWLDGHGLAGLDARQVVERLEATPLAERPEALVASVGAQELTLTEGERSTTLPLPEDAFYLSVAPYVAQTHDCFLHSLTTCRGELADAQVRVEVTDAEGRTVLAERRRTHENGFVGLWLPRGLEGTLRITAGGRTATVPVATGPDDPTCLTTARLV